MSAPLATLAQAEARIGRTLMADEETRLGALLVDASARIRAHIGSTQGDYPLESAVVQTCKVRRGGIVRLSMTPVVEITSVTMTDGTGIPFTPYGSAGLIAGIAGGAVINWPGDVDDDFAYGGGGGFFPWWLPSTVKVTYVAGYSNADPVPPGHYPVPDILVTICCQAALRALQGSQPLQPNAAGAGATTPPPGGVWLMTDEKLALDQALPRVPVGPISMYGPTAPEPTN